MDSSKLEDFLVDWGISELITELKLSINNNINPTKEACALLIEILKEVKL